jgi:adenylyltransferase/sulfurtransferase
MNDAELLRYSRHILLNEMGIEGQAQIRAGHVLIIGVGGLGCPAAQYLASAGVGTLTLVDHDNVDDTNLQRQVLYRAADVGRPKAIAARDFLHALNPDNQYQAVVERADAALLQRLIAAADVVLDCSDNFATRHAVNRVCVQHKTPLVSGAAIKFSGQVSVFDARQSDAPCYHCLFPDGEEVEALRCATTGVFAPLTGVVGAMQAAEALKLLAECGTASVGKLLLFDALRADWQTIRYRQDPHCAVCQTRTY